MALFLTQEDLDASLNEAQLILRSGARTAGFISLQSKQRAVDLLEEIVEACHNATAAPMLRTQNVAKYELAGTLQEAGYDVEARAMYLDAIDSFSAHDDCRVEAVDAKMAYGLLLAEADEMEAAIPLLEEAYSTYSSYLGTNDACTLRAGMNLANALADEPGRKDEAHRMLGAVVEGYITAFGEEHPDTLDGKLNYAVSHSDMGDVSRARSLYVEVLDVRRANLGPEHQDTLATQLNLANLLSTSGDISEARELMEEVVVGYGRLFGNKHSRTLRALMNLAVILKQGGELELARSLLAEIAAEYEEMYGVAHASTLRARVNLASCLCSMGRHTDARDEYVAVLEHSLPAHPWFEEATMLASQLDGESEMIGD